MDSPSDTSAPPALRRLLSGGGEMAGRLRDLAGAGTPLGPADDWPPALRTALGMMLGAGVPMAIHWGPELVVLYNDAWADALGAAHPDAFGRPAREVYADRWDTLGPAFERVLAGARGERMEGQPGGRTCTLDPLPDDDGVPAGVFSIAPADPSEAREEDAPPARDVPRQRLLEVLLRNTSVCIAVMTGPELRYTLVNDAYQQLRPDSPMLGRTYREVFPESVAAGAEAVVRRVLETGEPHEDFGFPAPIPGKPDATWDHRITPLPAGAGDAPAVLVTTWDVTARARAEAARRESEARFRTMADGLPLMIWVHDADGRQEFVNRTFCEFFGVTPEETADGAWRALMHPDDAAPYAREFDASIRERRRFHAEARVRRGDGAWRWVESWGRPRFSPQGAFLGLVGASADVTARRAIEQDLRRSESRYRELVENANSAILRWRRDGAITYFNEHAEALFGYSAREIVGRSVMRLVPGQESTGRDLSSLIADIVADPERYRHSVNENVRRDGSRIWMVWTNKPIRDEHGAVSEMLAIGSDVTELKRAQMALEEADRRKDEFLATLAHELRNPLAPLTTGLELLRLRSDDPSIAGRSLDMMARQLDHLVRLVDDLLEVSRITRGKVALRRERVDLAEVLAEAQEVSGPSISAGRRRLEVRMPAEALTVEGDRVRLVQIVSNLLNNAGKFTGDDGRIRLSAGRERDEAWVQVRDDGAGIPPDLLPRVFDLFSQGEDTRHRGLGIGLTLVRSLVELHGGRVEAKSAGVGQGAELTVHLPLAAPGGSAGTTAAAPAETATGSGRAPRALVVDDNRDAADSLGLLLELMGMETRVAYGGAEALQALAELSAEVAFLDIGMPGMDGYELARRIRDRPGPGPVLVAVTGWGQEEDRRRVLAAGFDHHLTKPVSMEGLQAVLAKDT